MQMPTQPTGIVQHCLIEKCDEKYDCAEQCTQKAIALALPVFGTLPTARKATHHAEERCTAEHNKNHDDVEDRGTTEFLHPPVTQHQIDGCDNDRQQQKRKHHAPLVAGEFLSQTGHERFPSNISVGVIAAPLRGVLSERSKLTLRSNEVKRDGALRGAVESGSPPSSHDNPASTGGAPELSE